MTKSWSILRDHIYYNMCDEDDNKFNWFMTWMAHIVQKPDEKYGMAVVVTGAEGSGKSNIFNNFSKVVGCERREYGNTFGHTIFCPFPQLTEKTNLVILDEWNARWYDANESALKRFISDNEFMIERKGEDLKVYKNNARFVLLTQDDFISDGSRRFVKFSMNNVHRHDANFHNDVWVQMVDEGGLQAFKEELENWVPPQEDGWDCLRRAPEEAKPYAVFDLETRGAEDNVPYATGGVLWIPKNDGWRGFNPWNIDVAPSSNTYGPDNWTAEELIHCVDSNGTAYLAEQNNWNESDVMSWYEDATRGEE